MDASANIRSINTKYLSREPNRSQAAAHRCTDGVRLRVDASQLRTEERAGRYDGIAHRVISITGAGAKFRRHKDDDQRFAHWLPATRAGARTSLFSSELNQFFLATPQKGGKAPEIRVVPTGKQPTE